MPGFEKLYTSRSAEGLVILGINEDDSREDMDNYLARRPVSFPILVDRRGEIMKKFGVRALPTTILVGPDGKVSGVYEGVLDYMDVLVDGLLKPAASASR
jgi:peroxiredoxin